MNGIYNEDSKITMIEMDNESIDLVIISPPYNERL